MNTIAKVLGVMLLFCSSVFADPFCACCVERGYYEMRQERPEAYVVGLLDEMKFNRKATLYMTEAGYDAVKGLSDIRAQIENDAEVAFDVVNVFLKRTWTLTLTVAGKKGTLTLPMPAQMRRFKVDTREPGNEDLGLGVSLYKEFSFNGRVASGTGIFRSASAAPTSYHLVFQGNGNGCDSSSDFRHWRLELRGAKTRFAVLGSLDVTGT